MVRALGLTEAVLGDASDRIVAARRARAARMYPSDFADCPEPVRYALLAALCWTRQAELVDGLADGHRPLGPFSSLASALSVFTPPAPPGTPPPAPCRRDAPGRRR